MESKLTSVKVLTDLYKKFKGLSIEEEFTLQKLVNRSMDLYCTDMKFQEKISFPLSSDDKSFIYEKAKETRQTVSGFIRSRLFDRTDLRREDQAPF